jgi:uncharacterized protein YneF (UPF0154 family)
MAGAFFFGTWCYVAYPWAEEQNVRQLHQLVQHPQTVINIGILLLVESVAGIMVARKLLEQAYGQPVKKYYSWLLFFPGFVPMAVVVYLEAYLFLQTVSYSYEALALVASATCAAVLILVPLLLRIILPERVLRLELLLLLQGIQVLVALVLPVKYNVIVLPEREYSLSLLPFASVVVLLLAGVLIGYSIYLWKRSKEKAAASAAVSGN